MPKNGYSLCATMCPLGLILPGVAVGLVAIINLHRPPIGAAVMLFSLFFVMLPKPGAPFRQRFLIGISVLLVLSAITGFGGLSSEIRLIIWQSAVLGILIGLGTSFFYWVASPIRLFRQSITPSLNAMLVYGEETEQCLKNHLFSSTTTIFPQAQFELAVSSRKPMQKLWEIQQSTYPVWVFAGGFNPGLRAGWRYFLIHLNQLISVWDALWHEITVKPELYSDQPFMLALQQTIQQDLRLLTVLRDYFKTGQFIALETDVEQADLLVLDQTLRRQQPEQLSLLEASSIEVRKMLIVNRQHETRQLLFKLILALPSYQRGAW